MQDVYQKPDYLNVVIRRCEASWLSIPLIRPYITSNNPKGRASLDVLLIRMTDDQGNIGWGEACPSWGGYSPETPESGWQFLKCFLPSLIGVDGVMRSRMIKQKFEDFPFVLSAINECVVEIGGDPLLTAPTKSFGFELAATVNTLDVAEAVEMAKKYVEDGYKTLKVKVGIEARTDAIRATKIFEAVKGKAKLRVDANRRFGIDAAYEFATNVPIEAIEYFEQPYESSNWEAIEALAKRSPIPLMLDESIYGPDDIERAAKTGCAKAVKLKMSKVGGPTLLREQIEFARGLGLDVVVGNGVATDFACYREALCCSRSGVTTAGEMNGFLKLIAPILEEPIKMVGPNMFIPAGTPPRLRSDALTKFAIHQANYS